MSYPFLVKNHSANSPQTGQVIFADIKCIVILFKNYNTPKKWTSEYVVRKKTAILYRSSSIKSPKGIATRQYQGEIHLVRINTSVNTAQKMNFRELFSLTRYL